MVAAVARREVSRSGRSRAQPAAAVVGYVRVSTEEQGDIGAGLEVQRQAIRAACAARGWSLVAVHQDVASGRSLERRPGLADALAAIAAGEAAGLVVAKLDRLSRSVIDAAQTIEQARREGWNLVALDLGVDFSTAAGEAMAHMTAVFAQLERRLIGERTRAALAVKKAQGVRLGRPPELPLRVRRRIVALHRRGTGWSAIAEQLNRDRVPTAHGGSQWYPATVRAVVVASSAAGSRVGAAAAARLVGPGIKEASITAVRVPPMLIRRGAPQQDTGGLPDTRGNKMM
jgi:DNA invertase Pin-like site-specific DNA recombinase